MYTALAVAVLGSAVVASAQVTQVQGYAPPAVLLTTTKSGVLPVLPTPFSGVLTEEGAIIDPGPVNGSFAGLAGPAVAQTNQPTTTYKATFPATMFNPYAGGNITGTVTAVGTSQGVQISINIQGLPPSSYGPFVYHIHGMPVPADGNCTSTLGHLDPTNRGEYYMCDNTQPQTCQAGDLAGKHGKITTAGTFAASYVEPYLSTNPSSPYFFGSGSIVIHTSNTTRLTCANFVQSASNSTGSGSSTSSAAKTSTITSTAGMTGTGVGATGTGSSSTRSASATSTSSSPSSVVTAGASDLVVGSLGGAIAGFIISLFL